MRPWPALAIAAALVLWTAGRFVALPSWSLALLLTVALGAGGVGLARSSSSGPWHRLMGAAGPASAVAFVWALLVPGTAVEMVHRGPGATPGERWRLVSLNVFHGRPGFVGQERRKNDLLAALRALEPDVVVLQEAWRVAGHGFLAKELAEALGFDGVYARANGSWRLIGFEEGSAVLSRWSVEQARVEALAPRRAFWERRVALVVTFADGRGGTFDIVSAHLSHRNERIAARQARSLAAEIGDGAWILAGDLNAESGSEAVVAFEEAGGVDLLPGGIDHVIVPGDVAGWRAVDVGWTLRPEDLRSLIGRETSISDHPGIRVDFAAVE